MIWIRLLAALSLLISGTFEFKSGTMRTAKNIPMGNLIITQEKYLIKDKTYYIMCQSGARSQTNLQPVLFLKKGFDVVDVAGGMGSYVGTKKENKYNSFRFHFQGICNGTGFFCMS